MRPISFISFAIALFVRCPNANAQLFSKSNPAFTEAIQKVINDVPNHMQNLLGALTSTDGQSTSYSCKLGIPGAINATVTSYHSTKDKSRSLQVTVLETESFDEARKKYNELVHQLKVGKFIYPGNKSSIKWDLNYDKPDESKNFAGSIFRPTGGGEGLKKLKLEVAMNSRITSYTVNLFVYEKVEDDQVEPENITDR